MLNNGIVFSLLMLLCINSVGKTRVIEKPLFEVRSIDHVEVKRVVLTAGETIFYLETDAGRKFSGIDSAIYLGADGKRYALREVRGAKLPRYASGSVEMDAGSSEFALVFPPLASSVERADLILSRKTKVQSCIWGISLKEERLPKRSEVPAVLKRQRLNPKGEWRDAEYRLGRTRLDIYFLGYRPEWGDAGSVSWGGLAPRVEDFVIPADGHVTLEFDQYLTAFMQLDFGGKKLGVVVDPGEQATLYVDVQVMNLRSSRYFRDVLEYPSGYFSGRRMDLNRYLLTRGDGGEEIAWNKDFGIDPERYVDLCVENYRKKIRAIDAATGLSEELRHYSRLEAQVLCWKRIYGMVTFFSNAYALRLGDERAPVVKAEYFTRLEGVDWTSDDLMFLDGGGVFDAVFRYFPGDEEVKSVFGAGYLSDLAKARFCNGRFAYKLPLREEELRVMRSATPRTAALFEMIYEEGGKAWKAHLARPGYRVCDAPVVSGEGLFDALMKPYRGKVVLIDFWGTSCRPCVKAMKLMKPLKKELKGEPVAYVYITGTSAAPLEVWQQMIPDIGGDHYRLERKLYQGLVKQFDIQGVPFYLVVDREGNIVYRGTGFMGCEKMRKLILELLNK